ncbi:NAD(+)--rifampin ADP-ribosyltransferase [bacterium]|nr:NAD(+)--rifampin ADP-ribosyltransferase [bacterium]
MEFSPHNKIVKLCLEGMTCLEKSEVKEANHLFFHAWEQATHDFEKFLAANYLAGTQANNQQELHWLLQAAHCAQQVDDLAARSAYPALFTKIATVYEKLNDAKNAEKYLEMAHRSKNVTTDKGPFYHGTKADLKVGDFLNPGGTSNYQHDLKMNHIYFTALPNGAGLAAALAQGIGRERVYVVEPIGAFENDPNVTDKKFPGNPTRSYRSDKPLKIVDELQDWPKIPEQELQSWRERLSKNKGEIIN